ncbi:MAG: tRNA 2-thiouridine(34) synthase MnmA [Acidimicrobiales bacterium]|nr:tRNA 2-thiouridine(34) synthase MnmA [Acidimicrobiales bacterium]
MKIAVGMSGGVDSSVAAALLMEQGHEVIGVTLKLWGGLSDSGCCSVSDVEDARRVALRLGIDHHVWGMTEGFDEKVVDPYVESHAIGETPNPCIECNRHIKFDAMFKRAMRLGFDAIATGHYARVENKNSSSSGRARLFRSVDDLKDQSYVLSGTDPKVLEHTFFPLGAMTKDEVRQVAAKLNFPTATKPDSQDVCFILATGGRKEFLEERIPLTPGKLVDHASGEVVGEVPALEVMTVGQRKEIGHDSEGQRRYVLDVNMKSKEVRIGRLEHLLDKTLKLRNVNFFDGFPQDGTPFIVQVSAHGKPLEAIWIKDGVIELSQAQRRVAAGQTVAFYDAESGTEVLGGGIVDRRESII